MMQLQRLGERTIELGGSRCTTRYAMSPWCARCRWIERDGCDHPAGRRSGSRGWRVTMSAILLVVPTALFERGRQASQGRRWWSEASALTAKGIEQMRRRSCRYSCQIEERTLPRQSSHDHVALSTTTTPIFEFAGSHNAASFRFPSYAMLRQSRLPDWPSVAYSCPGIPRTKGAYVRPRTSAANRPAPTMALGRSRRAHHFPSLIKYAARSWDAQATTWPSESWLP
ncbi:hypothetical protein OH76DRAFT_261107 [Lentinus brumalis]|uniref:Uncharacterized protein n=1 Tax=Lentinus brumalis TaxID=2498619 RepID=A0A371DGL5_9APHY|nr:hypothetical protein OH76DRAFT_261107 [Polyporus brumalis]